MFIKKEELERIQQDLAVYKGMTHDLIGALTGSQTEGSLERLVQRTGFGIDYNIRKLVQRFEELEKYLGIEYKEVEAHCEYVNKQNDKEQK